MTYETRNEMSAQNVCHTRIGLSEFTVEGIVESLHGRIGGCKLATSMVFAGARHPRKGE
jgi:hypothetical protein